MGIKKRSKVSAEFNMSSLTDIIFLLLIFFMLTSTVVAPNALNLKLPGTTRSKIPSSKTKMDNVRISTSGNFYLNGKSISIDKLLTVLGKKAGSNPEKFNFTIAPDKGTPVEHVIAVMNVALQLNINGILASDK